MGMIDADDHSALFPSSSDDREMVPGINLIPIWAGCEIDRACRLLDRGRAPQKKATTLVGQNFTRMVEHSVDRRSTDVYDR